MQDTVILQEHRCPTGALIQQRPNIFTSVHVTSVKSHMQRRDPAPGNTAFTETIDRMTS